MSKWALPPCTSGFIRGFQGCALIENFFQFLKIYDSVLKTVRKKFLLQFKKENTLSAFI